MSLDNEIAIAQTEVELWLRHNHLRAVAEDLTERLQWLDRWLPEETRSLLPPAAWSESLTRERAEIAAARSALIERRLTAMRAEEAALLLWQMELDAVADAVKLRERAHKQPPPKPRAALDRHVEAPQLSLDDRKSPRTDTDEWRLTVELPQAKLAKETISVARGPTVTMTPGEHAAADGALLPRSMKRRTSRMSPLSKTQSMAPQPPARPLEPEDPRDLVPLATPHDLPTIAPAQGQPPARHRSRAVTEPFVAALDLDGLYLKRAQITVDRDAHAVMVRLDGDARHVERDDMPGEPQQMTFRSREGDVQVFAVGGAQASEDGPSLLLDVQHWQLAELDAFERALDTLP